MANRSTFFVGIITIPRTEAVPKADTSDNFQRPACGRLSARVCRECSNAAGFRQAPFEVYEALFPVLQMLVQNTSHVSLDQVERCCSARRWSRTSTGAITASGPCWTSARRMAPCLRTALQQRTGCSKGRLVAKIHCTSGSPLRGDGYHLNLAGFAELPPYVRAIVEDRLHERHRLWALSS